MDEKEKKAKDAYERMYHKPWEDAPGGLKSRFMRYEEQTEQAEEQDESDS